MKRGTPNHPKTLELAAALGLPRWGAVGVLETLWHFAAQYARRGDVGRHTDGAIAEGLGWQGDTGRLMAALVETRWLDRCRCHRLRIHDWPEHADQTVRRTDEVKRLSFLECYCVVEPLRGTAFLAADDKSGPQEERGAEAIPPLALAADDKSGPQEEPKASASRKLAPDELKTSQPLPLPTPTTEPPHPPRATAPGGAVGPAQGDALAARRRAARPREGLVPIEASAESPGRPQRAHALRDGAAGGTSPPRAQCERDRDAAVRYWIQLGGRPTRADRRGVWEALRSGHPLQRILGSIAERVRDALVAAGRLGVEDPWPPAGLGPYDRAPPGDAAPVEQGSEGVDVVPAPAIAG